MLTIPVDTATNDTWGGGYVTPVISETIMGVENKKIIATFRATGSLSGMLMLTKPSTNTLKFQFWRGTSGNIQGDLYVYLED